MNFGEALTELKAGIILSRKGWNGVGLWIAIQPAGQIRACPMTLDYIYMETSDGGSVPWVASQTDILATDWQIGKTSTQKDDDMIIEPTVGSVVWYRDVPGALACAAIITAVHPDGIVGLHVLKPNGNCYGIVTVVLRQPGDGEPASGYCEWPTRAIANRDKIAEVSEEMSQGWISLTSELTARITALEEQLARLVPVIGAMADRPGEGPCPKCGSAATDQHTVTPPNEPKDYRCSECGHEWQA